ncbi:parvalbumin-like EF-hand-containing protein [Brienomyrus brachyistius]|uniref:parvalbumin-like EF-hand-containing protein n=1 Tax=Brienomyrus brachyistius TaxID=42636 RepID=UPI0020B18D87|nr:parvalbumin-like EF-hand-containing protein [Brienomyrus brachyistius]XP_048870943.1 parvalbumin-like EF-hand-containing protein [Brienomyrus brachyistius]
MEDDFGQQVKKVAMALGASLSDQDIERIPREMRLQGNFNYSLFLEYMRQFKTSEEKEEMIKRAFRTLDKDGSGYIEWNEIKYILSTIPSSVPLAPLSDDEAEAIMQVADVDGDGRINFKEFAEMVTLEKKPRK